MPDVKVYLITYKRNKLLQRALNSLINQTYKDWICEIHNDDPYDKFPKKLVESVNDPRIKLINHQSNLGVIKTFNIVFNAVEQKYISILEDDNWWEPNFLERMIFYINEYPEANLAWSNMRVWKETDSGKWVDTGKNIWDKKYNFKPKLYYWPSNSQINSAISSNGAMLIKSKYANEYKTPDNIPMEFTEAVRERMFRYPILFVPDVLANFAITKDTARKSDINEYIFGQIILISSYFKNVKLNNDSIEYIWKSARAGKAKYSHVLLYTAILFPYCRHLINKSTIQDWLFFFAYNLRHPFSPFRIIKLLKANKESLIFLNKITKLRAEEAFSNENLINYKNNH